MSETSIFVVVQQSDLDLVGDRMVLPLRLDLYWKAEERFGASRVVDASRILPYRKMVSAHARGLRWFSNVVNRLCENRRSPWLEGCGYLEMRECIYELSYHDLLLRELIKRGYRVAVPAELDRVQEWEVALPNVIWGSLFAVAAAARDRGEAIDLVSKSGIVPNRGQPRLVRWLFRSARAAVGRVLNATCGALPFLLRRRGLRGPDDLKQVDVLLLGAQLTDSLRQVSLAHRLEQRLGDRFAWLLMRPDATTLEQAEKIVFSGASGVRRGIYLDDLCTWIWRWWPLKTLAFAGTTWEMAALFHRTLGKALEIGRVELFDMLVHVIHAEAGINWYRWRRIMDSLRPKVILGNSVFHNMAFPVAWARRKKVPFCLMPSGAMYETADCFIATTGDVLFHHGPLGREIVQRCKIYPHGDRHLICGPLYVKDEIDVSREALTHEVHPGPPENKILFIEAVDNSYAYLMTPMQASRWFTGLARAGKKSGMGIVIRPHPRDPRSTYYYERLMDIMRAEGADVELDHGDSFTRSLMRCKAVIARLFDTACLKAMIYRQPVLTFLPEPAWHPLDAYIRKATSFAARTEDELATCLKRIIDDDRYTDELLGRQDVFATNYMDDSIPDGWGMIVDESCRLAGDPPDATLEAVGSLNRRVAH